LKGRNVKLSDYVVKIAGTLEISQTNADLVARDAGHLKVTPEQLKQYYKIGDDGKPSKVTTGTGTMDAVLVDVLVHAGRQFDRLNDTRVGLEQTRGTLGETSNTLVKTEGILATTKDTLAKTETELTATKKDVEKKASEITDLNGQVETAKADIEKKTGEIAKLTEKVSDGESKIEAGKRYIQKLEKDLKVCQGQFDTNALPKGLQGQITVVNTNWNFVVMDILPDSAMIPLTDLTIQREEKLVGKIRVSEVRRDQRVALGEILMDYQQMPPLRGDNVFY
jgi:septal ring factor EnvC (AmiA/AmiB activator)